MGLRPTHLFTETFDVYRPEGLVQDAGGGKASEIWEFVRSVRGRLVGDAMRTVDILANQFETIVTASIYVDVEGAQAIDAGMKLVAGDGKEWFILGLSATQDGIQILRVSGRRMVG